MADARNWEDSIGACTNAVGNSCNLATESNKPLIHRDNSLKKVHLTFKRGFIILKLAKISADLPPDSVFDVETRTSKVERDSRIGVT